MARIVAGVVTSHVPAIGAALDNGKSGEPYWKKVFDGYEFSKEWIRKVKPDVILLVYIPGMVSTPCQNSAKARSNLSKFASSFTSVVRDRK